MLSEFCFYNIKDKNNRIEKIIFNTILFIRFFQVINLESEKLTGNLYYKIPNKIFFNNVKYINLANELLTEFNENIFVEYFIHNYQEELPKITNKKIKINPNYNKSDIEENLSNSCYFNNKKIDNIHNQNTDFKFKENYKNIDLNQSSSLLNLDFSLSLKDNKSIINLFNQNPIKFENNQRNDYIYDINNDCNNKINLNNNQNLYKKLNRDFYFQKIKYNNLNKQVFQYMNKNHLNNVSYSNNEKNTNIINPNLISIEDLHKKDDFSLISKNSYFSENNLSNFLNLNVNINSHSIQILHNSIIDTINLFILNFFILKRMIENKIIKNKNTSLIKDDKEKNFFRLFINVFLTNNKNNQYKILCKNSEEDINCAETNLIKRIDLEIITKIIIKNYLIFCNNTENIQDIIEHFQFFCLDYILNNNIIIEKVFEETLFLKMEIITRKIGKKFILINKIIEMILFFANVLDLGENMSFNNISKDYQNEYNQNYNFQENKKKHNIDLKSNEIYLNFNLIYSMFMNKYISDKLKQENESYHKFDLKDKRKKIISNNLIFNESNESFVEKICFILNFLDSKITKQILLINYSIINIKFQNIIKINQILFLYLFDSLASLIRESNKEENENSDLLNSIKHLISTKQDTIIKYFQIFINIDLNHINNTNINMTSEIKTILTQIKNQFSNFIFFQKFENKIFNILEILIINKDHYQKINNYRSNNPNDYYNSKKLIDIVKDLHKNIQEFGINLQNEIISNNLEGNSEEIKMNFLNYNQRKIINLLKKNSNLNC